jgi:hypothetical protein
LPCHGKEAFDAAIDAVTKAGLNLNGMMQVLQAPSTIGQKGFPGAKSPADALMLMGLQAMDDETYFRVHGREARRKALGK